MNDMLFSGQQKPDRQSRYYTTEKQRSGSLKKRKKKKQKSQKNHRVLAGAAGILLCVILAVAAGTALFSPTRGSSLKGEWRFDEVTGFEFDGKGSGALLVSESRYPFEYSTAEVEVKLQFEDPDIAPAAYQFSVKQGILNIIDSETGQSYTLEKF